MTDLEKLYDLIWTDSSPATRRIAFSKALSNASFHNTSRQIKGEIIWEGTIRVAYFEQLDGDNIVATHRVYPGGKVTS